MPDSFTTALKKGRTRSGSPNRSSDAVMKTFSHRVIRNCPKTLGHLAKLHDYDHLAGDTLHPDHARGIWERSEFAQAPSAKVAQRPEQWGSW